MAPSQRRTARTQNVSFIRNEISHPTTQEILENRRQLGTRKQYAASIKRVITAMIKVVDLMQVPEGQAPIPDNLVDHTIGEDGFLNAEIPLAVYKSILEEMSIKYLPNGERTMMSQTAFTGVQSAIVYWHEKSSESRGRPITLSAEHLSFYRDYAKGRKRTIAGFRTHGLMSCREGKHYLSFKGYRLIAKMALLESSSSRENMLAHSFSVIGWNLMSRSVTVSPLLWNDIGWVGDCMTITYQTSKTNQEGLHVVPRHIFANPVDPLICPVLALGLKLISESDFESGKPSKIFYGPCGNQRFSMWLTRALNRMTDEEIAELGCPPRDLGTHSFRKGAATYVCGLVDGPHTDSVKLRMDHTIGSTDDRYIHIQAGSDKRVGRCVTGLDSNNDDFCYLPPLFTDFDGVSFADVLPDGRLENSNESLKSAIPFMIASVIHHAEWLENNLPRTHPFFVSKLYTGGFIARWIGKISLSKRICPVTKLTMSGVPGYAQISQHVAELRATVEKNHEETTKLMKDLPQVLCDSIISKIGSAHDVRLTDEAMFERVFRRALPDRNEEMNQLVEMLRQALRLQSQEQSLRAPGADDSGEFRSFQWGNGSHIVPEGYQLPQGTSLDIWRLWIFGCRTQRISPLCQLVGSSLSDKSQKSQFCKAKFVMEYIHAHIDLSYDQIRALGMNQAEIIFKEVFSAILGWINGFERIAYSNAYIYLKEIEKDINPSARKKSSKSTSLN